MTVKGPLCQRCYKAPMRACGKCGNVRPIAARVQLGDTDLCKSCVQSPDAQCGLCGKTRPTHAHWPLGPVCFSCYKRSTNHPDVCSSCGHTKVLIGHTPAGELACGPCAGSLTDYVCATCDQGGPQHYEGTCLSCSIRRLTEELLTAEDGSIREGLDMLPDLLARRGRPASTLRWLIKARTQEALRFLATAEGALTHATVDACPPGQARHYLRALLVEANVLTRRDEPIERLETWIDEFTASLAPRHAALLEPYARWGILRTARRRAARRGFTANAADSSRERIRLALRLIEHVESSGHRIGDLTQTMLDDWTAGDRNRSRRIKGFVAWLNKRGIVENVTLARGSQVPPSEISDEQDHRGQIAKLLDEHCGIELQTRVAGLLVLLYGAKLVNIQRLTTAHVTSTGPCTQLTLVNHPIELPESVATLVNRLTQQASQNPRAQTPDSDAHFLFPGARAHEPIHTRTLSVKLAEAGVPSRLGRNYAMVALTSDLPAAIVAAQLGLSASATTQWAKFGQRDRTEYLLARRKSETEPTQSFREHHSYV
ncbi:hypothetical protein [Mycolicibacterium aromaticivorans]|uniref:hypothetical protein n=1 Tax=Mycolicibacterium aromaticivorans TaxID=318425 RepID=UPI00103A430F|nr:hypothetical protein [Mycolicibacterium aromaticivorans]